jgi:hypothetical protein
MGAVDAGVGRAIRGPRQRDIGDLASPVYTNNARERSGASRGGILQDESRAGRYAIALVVDTVPHARASWILTYFVQSTS